MRAEGEGTHVCDCEVRPLWKLCFAGNLPAISTGLVYPFSHSLIWPRLCLREVGRWARTSAVCSFAGWALQGQPQTTYSHCFNFKIKGNLHWKKSKGHVDYFIPSRLKTSTWRRKGHFLSFPQVLRNGKILFFLGDSLAGSSKGPILIRRYWTYSYMEKSKRQRWAKGTCLKKPKN